MPDPAALRNTRLGVDRGCKKPSSRRVESREKPKEDDAVVRSQSAEKVEGRRWSL